MPAVEPATLARTLRAAHAERRVMEAPSAHDAAFDLTAETFAQAWIMRRRFRDEAEGSAAPWLFGIARNVLLMSVRRGRLERRLLFGKRRADKRGGAAERVTLTSDIAAAPEPNDLDVLTLHESLERLAAFDPQQERIVELRYFGGLTIEETAEVVGVSTATVTREWTIAKAWLRADMSAVKSG